MLEAGTVRTSVSDLWFRLVVYAQRYGNGRKEDEYTSVPIVGIVDIEGLTAYIDVEGTRSCTKSHGNSLKTGQGRPVTADSGDTKKGYMHHCGHRGNQHKRALADGSAVA